MKPEIFFDLFVEELKRTPELRAYYKVLENPTYLEFRKSYLVSRWRYVQDCLGGAEAAVDRKVWDFGCGYGTTALFLAMNGYRVYGSTIGIAPHIIPNRRKYWAQFGDSDLFSEIYVNLFASDVPRNYYDFIIAQDTLHHLEPIQEGLAILRDALKARGKLIVLEENGQNLIQSLKLYLRRGNNRITTIRDEISGDMVLVGNENIRSFDTWRRLFKSCGLSVDAHPQYIRYFLPQFSRGLKAEEFFVREQCIAEKYRLLRDYFFFGINFEARRSES